MSDLNNGLLTRIETLEKQNRRMRWAGGLLATLAVTGMGMSMAGPRVCKTVWGERFVLKDSSLRERMVLDAYSTRTPSLAFKDIEGKKIAAMAETRYVQVAPHLYCGPVAAAANIQLAACIPNFLILGLGGCGRILSGVLHLDLDFDMVAGL